MLLGWLRRRRRTRLPRDAFPAAWEDVLARLPFTASLEEGERARLKEVLRRIVEGKRWEGCGGLEITDEMRVTIAAEAARLLLGLPYDGFPNVRTILVYPAAFRVPGGRPGGDGIVTEGQVNAGEAWPSGPVILSWEGVESGLRHPEAGRNLVVHEFAHKLDQLDGYADGAPPPRARGDLDAWRRVMDEAYRDLVRASDDGRATVLDVYGATNPAEFFAVASEAFFERPEALEREHPRLYRTLASWFGQDTAGRSRRAREEAALRPSATGASTPRVAP
jgi:MtfA peptidase